MCGKSVADEFRRVITGVDDAVVLPEQLLARILRDLAELVVDVGDPSVLVGDGDDARLIDRVLQIAKHGGTHHARGGAGDEQDESDW